ncbi:very short patch repair endonuclease [Stomatobaculum longum]|uniref:very short patch repair endonuclease n=1 Tax=Stomatobaculum longum TaxID=796942 RepID=UPI0028054EF3|nr:very short patch repair endonuclease [Stomatobaculum longum]
MADGLSPEKRSWNMSRIKGKNTSIEVKVRKYLFSQGFRYRINVTKLPGKPDMVLPKYNAVVFVNCCFWHRHTGCKEAYMPKSQVEFWQKIFERNVQNDTVQREKLMEAGWSVFTVWECEVKKNFEVTMDELIEQLKRA